jgi:hypothetical protein
VTSRDQLLHIAGQIGQLDREIRAMAAPQSKGGIPLGDVSISASHEMIVAATYLGMAAAKIMQTASFVRV